MRGSFAVLVTGFVFLAGCNVLLGTCGLEADLPGATGGSGGAGSGAGSGEGGAAPCDWCPEGMLLVPAEAGSFAIDAREVTVDEYEEFLASSPSPSLAPSDLCGVNESYEIGVASETAYAANSQADVSVDEAACQTWLTNRSHIPKMPVTCVDWCDAYAYCAWAGKKLCGSFEEDDPYVVISNEQGEALRHKDISVSRWFAGCAGPLARAFPYGDTFDSAMCNDENMGAVEPSQATCVGGYAGIYDMSGNAGEWEAACTRYGNPDAWNQNCLIRGGSFYEGTEGGGGSDMIHEPLSCGARRDNYLHLIGDAVGFRCCQDPPE